MSKLFTVAVVAGFATSVAACGPDGPTRADTGLAVGAVAGGIIGNQVGKGTGRVLATAAGAFVVWIMTGQVGDRAARQSATSRPVPASPPSTDSRS